METSAWSSRPSPVSLSAGPLPRCLHQPVGGQLSLEQSTLWGVCLLGPPAPPDAAPRRGVSGGGGQCGAMGAAGGLELDHLGGLWSPSQTPSLLRVG